MDTCIIFIPSPQTNIKFMKTFLIAARILVYNGSHAEKVIYLRTGMDVDFAIRWRWYFDYLAALVKVHHPKRKVELYIGPQNVKLGQESKYVNEIKQWIKDEPKFHEGDWIISNDKKSIYQVIEVKRGIYVIKDNTDNHEYYIDIEACERSGRLWNISDAKDGVK